MSSSPNLSSQGYLDWPRPPSLRALMSGKISRMILPKLAVLSGRQQARLSQYFLSEWGAEWEDTQRRSWVGSEGPWGSRWGKSLLTQALSRQGALQGQGGSPMPTNPPSPRPPVHPPIGIVNTLLWQTGVSVLFQVVTDPPVGVHVFLIAECTGL